MPVLAKFLLPSIAGVLLFLVPFEVDGTKNVLLGIISNWITAEAGEHMRSFCAFVFISSGIVTPVFTWGPKALRDNYPETAKVFATGPFSAIARMAGAVFSGLVFWDVGPEWVVDAETGQMAYVTIAAIIFCIIGIGASSIAVLVTARQYVGGY